MVCPECHTEKPWTSPRCPNCNQHVGIIASLLWNLIAGVMSLVLFFLILSAVWNGLIALGSG